MVSSSVMLHEHCHGKLDEYNHQSLDLRFDVGMADVEKLIS